MPRSSHSGEGGVQFGYTAAASIPATEDGHLVENAPDCATNRLTSTLMADSEAAIMPFNSGGQRRPQDWTCVVAAGAAGPLRPIRKIAKRAEIGRAETVEYRL